MYKYLLLSVLFLTQPSYANCISNPNNLISGKDLRDVLNCLQNEINQLKIQNLHLRQGLIMPNQASKPLPTNTVYVIQVLATPDKSLAIEVKETFEVLGYLANIRLSQNTRKKSKSNLYKVMLGNYKWKTQAAKESNLIRKRYPRYKDCFVATTFL